MKTTLTLLPGLHPYTNNQLQEIHAGVLDGFGKLSNDVKKQVEWVGVGLGALSNICTEVKVAWVISLDSGITVTLRANRFFYPSSEVWTKTREETEENFIKTVNDLLREISESLRKNSERIEETLTAHN